MPGQKLIGLGVPVFVPAEANLYGEQLARHDLNLTRVGSGEEFTAAGFRVSAVGGRHAQIYAGQPDCANLGYVVEDRLYHPGDSVFVPEQPIETLLVPAHASWLKTAEAIDFVRAVRPERAFPIHDAQINERGLEGVNGWLGEQSGTDYRWLAPGETA